MLTRNDVIRDAVDKCMEELYSYAQPSITWGDFVKENTEYNKKYKEWESKDIKDKPITESIGPRPYEFYFLPKEILNEVALSYVYAYKLDNQQNLLDIIETLKGYCKDPIVDKYIKEHTDEFGNWHPGYKSYEHPDNLEKKLRNYIIDNFYDSINPSDDITKFSKELLDEFFKFLDMAGKFYNWNSELNAFNMNVYLGASPNSNKETVIENWKKYRGKDIEINEEQIIKDFYGDDD